MTYSIFILAGVIKEVKLCYLDGNDDMGYEPCCGTICVPNGTVMSIGHLFAASICNGGAAPCFLPQWLYIYISKGLQSVLTCLPSTLPPGSCCSEIYGKVNIIRLNMSTRTLFHKIHCSQRRILSNSIAIWL